MTPVVESRPQGQGSRALGEAPHHPGGQDPVVVPGQGDVHVVVGDVGGKVTRLEYLEMLIVEERDVAGVPLPEAAGRCPPWVPRGPALLVVVDQASPGVVLGLVESRIVSDQCAHQAVEIISDIKS